MNNYQKLETMNTNKIYKLGIFIFIALFLASGCELEQELEGIQETIGYQKPEGNQETEGDQETVGNGIITTRQVVVQDFSELYVNGILTVYLKQGDSARVEVLTDENLQYLVEVEQINNMLSVNQK